MVNINETIEQLKGQYATQNVDTKMRLINCDKEQFEKMILRNYYEILLKANITDISQEALHRIESIANWFFDGGKPSLCLTGVVGMGKSTLMRATSMSIGQLYFYMLGSERKESVYVECAELATIYDNEPYRIEKMKHCDILFLDDLGTEPAIVSKFGNKKNLFTEILLCRYEEKKTTIITTNLSRQDIVTTYGNCQLMQDRIADRLFETFDFRIFKGAESFRKINGQNNKC